MGLLRLLVHCWVVCSLIKVSQAKIDKGYKANAFIATWRWCFFINLVRTPQADLEYFSKLSYADKSLLQPIGAITMVVIVIFFTAPHRQAVASLGWKERVKEFDLYGTVVFIPSIICLLLALQWGGTKYPWSSGRIIALFVVFGVLIAVFIAIQFWKEDSATVPPSIMKKRSMAAASWFSFTLGSFFLLLIYFLPIVRKPPKDNFNRKLLTRFSSGFRL